MVEASDVADMAAQALTETANQPPPLLPPGWLLKESRSHPGAFYYYQQETGISTWDPPPEMTDMIAKKDDDEEEEEEEEEEVIKIKAVGDEATNAPDVTVKREPDATGNNSHKRSRSEEDGAAIKREDPVVEQKVPNKRPRKTPKEVRVLHILKKHKDSKRPASWRSNNKPITITREQAIEELEGLLEILSDDADNPESLIATFKELASQESDCNSAKRKGDLGMFGRKKMRPEFEEAAFGLEINEMSGIVETASGAHILLRLE